MLHESIISQDDPKIVGKSSSEEGSCFALPAKHPQFEFLEGAMKQQQRKLQVKEEKDGTDTSWNIFSSFLGNTDENKSADLNRIYRDELEKGSVKPIQKDHKKQSELETFIKKVSALSPDELDTIVDKNATDFKDWITIDKQKDGISDIDDATIVGDASDEDAVSRYPKRNTVTEEGDRDGLDPHFHQSQHLHNESEAQNSWKKKQHHKNKKMSSTRRKNPSVTAQSEILTEIVQRQQQEQEQQRPSFIASFFSDGTSNNQDLNDAYRNEMLRSKLKSSSNTNSSLSIKAQDSKIDAEAQHGNNEEGDDKFEPDPNAPPDVLLNTAAGPEERLSPTPPSASNSLLEAFSRSSYAVGGAVLAPATYIHNTVSTLMMQDSRNAGGDEDDAVEALENRDLDESPNSKFILHLVS
ncbi:MAG: hypothetical protein SGBAC_002690 [Bacillariaceae sp.]